MKPLSLSIVSLFRDQRYRGKGYPHRVPVVLSVWAIPSGAALPLHKPLSVVGVRGGGTLVRVPLFVFLTPTKGKHSGRCLMCGRW